MLNGSQQSWMEGWKHQRDFSAGQFSIIYSPVMQGYTTYGHNNANNGLGICVHLDTIRRQLFEDPRKSIQTTFLPFFQDKPSSFLIQGPMDFKMMALIKNLSRIDRPSIQYSFEKQSRLYQLLQLCIEQSSITTTHENKNGFLSRSDIEKLNKAKHILKNEMQCPPKQLELSRMIGLNDFKLKKGFKQVYGQTVF